LFLTASDEDVDHLADLGLAADDRVDLAAFARGQVDRELVECGVLLGPAGAPVVADGPGPPVPRSEPAPSSIERPRSSAALQAVSRP